MDGVYTPAVVVGLDHSDASQSAIRYAVDLAVRLHRPLRVVRAYEPSRYSVPPEVDRPTKLGGALRSSAERQCSEAVDAIGVLYPDLDVTMRLQSGSAAELLLEESEHAAVVVLGRRGSGGFANLLLGSTTLQVAAHAHCPVLAIPGPGDHEQAKRGVVVGIDGSEACEAAIGYAFQTATELGEPLTAVHAWLNMMAEVGFMSPGIYYPTAAEDEAAMETDARLLLAESLAGWSEKYPDVDVTAKATRRHPVRALVDEAAHASLLVVSSRGRGTLRSLALGSVGAGVLHHAISPVAVVR